MEPNEIEKENLNAMDKLLAEKETLDKRNQSRYRYYEDLYGNEYRWTTHPQKDGKFNARILKAKTSGDWLRHTTTKTRNFVKRKIAKAWCLKHYLKANTHQKIVLDARAERKQQRLDAKPKFTPIQKAIKSAESKIQHYKDLQKKCDKKLRSLNTRKKTYQKRIKYHQNRVDKLSRQIETLI